MKTLLWIGLVLVALLVCWLAFDRLVRPSSVIGGNGLATVKSEDAGMNMAIQEARATLDEFVSMLRNPCEGCSAFTVKKPFENTEDGAEHVWITEVRLVGDGFVGVVDNVPVNVPRLKYGEKVHIQRDEVTDWMYMVDGEVVGGRTIRVLMDRATPQERATAFNNLRFRDPARVPKPKK